MRKIICDCCGNETTLKGLGYIRLYTNTGKGDSAIEGKRSEQTKEVCVDCQSKIRNMILQPNEKLEYEDTFEEYAVPRPKVGVISQPFLDAGFPIVGR